MINLKIWIKSLFSYLYIKFLPITTKPPGRRFKGRYYSLNRVAVIRFLEENAGEVFGKVLDVGSGKWTLPRELLEHQCQYTSTDCFEDPNIDVVSDILELSEIFPKNEFDFVLCFEVLEHVSRPWLAVGQLYAILKPGGTLLLTTPFNFRFHGNNIYRDYWRFTPEGLRMLLEEEAGFQQIEIKSFGHPDFPFNIMVKAKK